MFKKLHFDTVPVKFSELATYLAKDGLDYKMVPSLRYGDSLFTDSWNIALELEKLSPSPAIFPSEEIKSACRIMHFFAVPEFLVAIFVYICPFIYEKTYEIDKEFFYAKVKNQTGSTIEQLIADRPARQARFRNKTLQLETALGDSTWFLPQFSYADMMLFAALKWVDLIVGPEAPFNEQTPRLAAWYRRVQEKLAE